VLCLPRCVGQYLNGHIDALQGAWARYAGAFLLAFMVSIP